MQLNKLNARQQQRVKDLVTIGFAANYFDVCPKTVRNWIEQGLLPAYEVGHRLIRLDYEEIRNMPVPIHGIYKRGKDAK